MVPTLRPPRTHLGVRVLICLCAGYIANAGALAFDTTGIPPGILEIARKLETDPAYPFGLWQAPPGVDPALQIDDIQAGLPIPWYRMGKGIDTCRLSADLDSLLEPMGYWYIPIKSGDEFIYRVKASEENGVWRVYESTAGVSIWRAIDRLYPDGTDMRPVLLRGRMSYLVFLGGIDDKSVYPITGGSAIGKKLVRDRFGKWSADSLVSDRQLIKYYKDNLERWREKTKEFKKKYPGFYNDTSGGAQ